MDAKLVVFVVILVLAVHQEVEAEFFYNRVLPKENELSQYNFKCVPGRTVMKMQASSQTLSEPNYDGYYSDDYLRSHTNFKTDDGSCQICVCSSGGKDEYCSKRPAKNVNECMRMASILDRFSKNEPFDYERSLSFRIRRDYVWHNDEIPYAAKSKCQRGHSYYSNSVNANDTDVDVGSDIESLLDYNNAGVCYYCICSVDGKSTHCFSRNPWFCEFFRLGRKPTASRDAYVQIFGSDRPMYFRSLSYRLRRTMDNGMFDLMDSGGDTLCCDHPNAHRRHLHHQIRNKIRLMRKKVNKENLMSGAPGGDYVDFVVNND